MAVGSPMTTKTLRTPSACEAKQVALNTQQVAAAGREVEHGLNANFLLDDVANRPGAHAHARHRAVGHIDHICPGFSQETCPGFQFMGREAARRIHFDGNDEFFLG